MTTQEFDTEFDVLYNNITSNQAPGLNAYEKSVFLTKAQNQLLSEFFNHRTDIDSGFDGSEERQTDFSNIISTESLQDSIIFNFTHIDPRSHVFKPEGNVLFILNEFLDVVVNEDTNEVLTLTVSPLAYPEYQRLMRKPYNYPIKGNAWRLYNNGYFEIISKYQNNTQRYRVRYVRKPCPIILEDLADFDVSIDNVTDVTQCELPEETHHKILERAVALARIAWQGSSLTQEALIANENKQKKDK